MGRHVVVWDHLVWNRVLGSRNDSYRHCFIFRFVSKVLGYARVSPCELAVNGFGIRDSARCLVAASHYVASGPSATYRRRTGADHAEVWDCKTGDTHRRNALSLGRVAWPVNCGRRIASKSNDLGIKLVL